MTSYILDPQTGHVTPVEDRPTTGIKITAEWCDGGHESEFLCYPENGACECGVWKHHVHGHVIQVG